MVSAHHSIPSLSFSLILLHLASLHSSSFSSSCFVSRLLSREIAARLSEASEGKALIQTVNQPLAGPGPNRVTGTDRIQVLSGVQSQLVVATIGNLTLE